MGEITNCINQYKENYNQFDSSLKVLLSNYSKTEWNNVLVDNQSKSNNIYYDNKEIVQSLNKLCLNLNDESASELYDALLKMYFEDYDDAYFLLNYAEILLAFYEERDDKVKVLNLYSLCQNVLLLIKNPVYFKDSFDMSYIKKGMAFINDYFILPEDSRYRVHILYYTYLVRYLDLDCITLSEALDTLDEYIKFNLREDVKELDKDSEKIHNIIEYIKNAFLIGITKVFDSDYNTQTRYYEFVKNYFDENFSNVEGLYELSALEYAGYVYKCYFEKEISLDELFDKYFDYFEYKVGLLYNLSTLDQHSVLDCASLTAVATYLMGYVKKKDTLNKAVELLKKFVEGRWLKGEIDYLERINGILSAVCVSLVKLDLDDFDKDKCVKQLIVQRNFPDYVKATLVSDISITLYREISASKSYFFDSIKSIPKSNWKDYLHYAAMFHDIGKSEISIYRDRYNRPMFDFEKADKLNHIIAGRSFVKNIPYMEKYDDIINGHHVYYDESAGYSDNFKREECRYTPFVDIISLAVYIEERTNYYWDYEQKSIPFEKLISEIENERGRRFNPDLVDLIIGSSELQSTLTNIVTSNRDNVVYDLCHNWQKIQFSEDEESVLNNLTDKILEYRNTRDKEAFSDDYNRLLSLIYNTRSEKIRAKAMFQLMRCYFIEGDFERAFAIEVETNRLLTKYKFNDLVIKNNLNIGNAELIRENLEAAMSRYLMAYEIARVTPECYVEKNLAIASIANIYARSSNYAKANEYYEMVDTSDIDDYELLKIICMRGQCNIELGNKEAIETYYFQLVDIFNIHPEYKEYSLLVYLALFSNAIGKKDELDEYIKEINDYKLSEQEFKYCSDEVMVYMNLLEKVGRFDELKRQLDYYINIGLGKEDMTQICMDLLTKRIHIVSIENHNVEFLDYESKLLGVISLAQEVKSRQMEGLEKTFMENIKLQSAHENFISEKNALEASVLRAKNESEHKSQFLSSMSHEIRTPINAILGLNEMILRESNENEILQYATDINNAGKQLLGIVNDILDYSKIEAGKMEIIPQKYTFGELVNDIKNMIEPKLSEKGLQYKVIVNPEIPNVLFGDDLRIKQILLNLLSNAYKYTNEGYVSFIIDYNKVDEKTIDISFEIKDSGVGMTEEQLGKLTNPFVRFENASTRGVEGTGLGMSIVTSLLEQMNSKLVVNSSYGEGSSFSFNLLQKVVEWGKLGKLDDVKKKVLSNNMDKKKDNIYTVIAPDAKILVVDDNAVNLKVIQALLKRNKVQVTAVSSGKEALEICKTTGFELIFLDHMMPEMDGIETLKIIKQMGGINAETPIVALTANVTESGEEFYGKAGFDSLLTKPVDFDKLEETLRRFLPNYMIQ